MKSAENNPTLRPGPPRSYRRLWIGLIAVISLSFVVLGYFGGEIYRKAPPIPNRVIAEDGRVLFTAQDIRDGQNVWQSMGGQQVGSIWGHGAFAEKSQELEALESAAGKAALTPQGGSI
jgi:nitric oxide reductase subunit B